jgi:hypothetical protein
MLPIFVIFLGWQFQAALNLMKKKQKIKAAPKTHPARKMLIGQAGVGREHGCPRHGNC